MAEDPPLINETPVDGEVPQIPFPSKQYSQYSRRTTMKGLVWKVKKLVLNSAQTAFLGSTTHPPELRDQAATGTPYSIFSYFLTSEILEKIVEESNLYSVQKNVTKPLNLTETELRKFYRYLCQSSNIPTSGFTGLIPGREHPQHDRLYKIRPIISHLNEKFASVPMEQRLSIDEQMCATKVAHFMKQYLPNKPHRWVFKLYVMCSVKGYDHKFEIYTGQKNERF
ncbi:unnamed protein product [Euphydryas editha]|uniref:PiggyBac transposable element-derived protein domain-containing protein n=1 Tax=Euphydryas editha TaxID=104508 RepID=A0AAU9UTA1_EUPED|nr:unnamed protein product [Euphydryas editha]